MPKALETMAKAVEMRGQPHQARVQHTRGLVVEGMMERLCSIYIYVYMYVYVYTYVYICAIYIYNLYIFIYMGMLRAGLISMYGLGLRVYGLDVGGPLMVNTRSLSGSFIKGWAKAG